MGRDVHVITTARAIQVFLNGRKEGQLCFRCGELGHMRHQCMTYKVQPCWHHDQGGCRDPLCTFAHGPDELRTPWRPKCVRVVRQGDRFVCIGCHSTEHTFRRCPHARDLMVL